MSEFLSDLAREGSLLEIALLLIVWLVLFVLFVLGPSLAFLYLLYYLLTLPMRRNERARLFLDLLELGLKQGRTPEAAIPDASRSGDRSLGRKFHRLAPYLEQGMRLSQGLEKVPRLLPPQVVAMLKTGERIGDVRKVFPACRLLLRDSVSQVRSAVNYLVVLGFVATPFTIAIPLVLRVKVLPSFKMVFEGMYEGMHQLPPFTQFVMEHNLVFLGFQVGLMLLIWIVTLAYLGGPRLRSWLDPLLPGDGRLLDRVAFSMPWKRKRLQRDFSHMLAILLEAEVPEPEAVHLAAQSTANAVFVRRSEQARARLNEGVPLPEALRALDNSGELHWRLTNAFRRAGGFVRALAGWHEALDAKAFQLEQTAAQTVTTVVLLVNGAVVACIVISLFLALIQLINHVALW